MTISDSQLSSELQELYLGNKEKLSDITFMESETRFFQKLVEKLTQSPIHKEKFSELASVNLSLAELQTRRDKLKTLVNAQQRSIELLLNDLSSQINISLINESTAIVNELGALLKSDRLLKGSLYGLAEYFMAHQKTGRAAHA